MNEDIGAIILEGSPCHRVARNSRNEDMNDTITVGQGLPQGI
jgi:hypothetical protein